MSAFFVFIRENAKHRGEMKLISGVRNKVSRNAMRLVLASVVAVMLLGSSVPSVGQEPPNNTNAGVEASAFGPLSLPAQV